MISHPLDKEAAEKKEAARLRARRLVLLVWILVAFFYFNLSYDYIRVSMNDMKFAEYLQYVVQIAAVEQRPAREVRALLLVKAEELELPIRGEQIQIRGSGSKLNVAVGYEVDIEIPIFARGVYRKQFHHNAYYKLYKGI